MAGVAQSRLVYRGEDVRARNNDRRGDRGDAERPVVRCRVGGAVVAKNMQRRIVIAMTDPVTVIPCKCVLGVRGGKRSVAFH
eukprot:scaffold689_cov186-Amphora_coffeaeformis.AAC.16